MVGWDTTDARPARPILASSLLPSADQKKSDDQQEENHASKWELNHDIEDGVALLSSGRVVGLSPFLPSPGEPPDLRQERLNDIQHGINGLVLRMLVDFLAKKPHTDNNPAKAFVIQFYDSQQLSSEQLCYTIKERYPAYPPETVEAITNNVKVLSASRFNDILEAVNQLSDILFELQQQHQTAEQNPQSDTQLPHSPPSVLLLIDGLDQSLWEVIRASSPATASSVMVPLLRTLTLLTRTYESFLTVLVVNSMPIHPHNHPPASIPSTGGSTIPGGVDVNVAMQYDPDIPVQSIFGPSPSTGRSSERRSQPARSSAGQTFMFSLVEPLDLGFDVHLLVSKVHSHLVVEVAKDRVGDSLGRWCEIGEI